MTAERDRRGRDRALRRQAAGGAALAILLLLGFSRPSTAAQPNQLLNPRVDPAGGTTRITITFSVRYESTLGNAPTSVTATVGNIVVPLTLSSGSAANGRYRGSTKLPAGTWSVLFQASAQGNDPSLDGPVVTIKPAPTPTPKPTPRPTPRPTVAPTQAPPPSSAPQTTEPRTPRPSRPSRNPSPSEQPSPGETQPPGSRPGTATAEPTEGAPIVGGIDTSGDRQLITIITGGLIAVGALTLIGIFALLRDRRRKATEASVPLLAGSSSGEAAPPVTPAQRTPTTWERDFALDQEPIGTVEYRPPPQPDEKEN